MVLAQSKAAAYKDSSAILGLAEVLVEMEASTTPGTEEIFKPQKVNAKKASTSGQMLEVDVEGMDFDSASGYWDRIERGYWDRIGTSDRIERGATRNTARPWWVALETTKVCCWSILKKR